MKNWKTAIALGLILSATVAWSDYDGKGGGSGEIPTPFEASNQKVELADGEVYLLMGRIVIRSENNSEKMVAFFEVDLKEHSWLASAKRKANPLYPLAGSANYWKQYRGMRIKLPCQARGVVALDGGKLDYRIELMRSTSNPIEPAIPVHDDNY